MGGNMKLTYPNTGQAFTSAKNGYILPEYYVDKTNPLKIEDGAELYEVNSDGTETLRAVYDKIAKRWLSIDEK